MLVIIVSANPLAGDRLDAAPSAFAPAPTLFLARDLHPDGRYSNQGTQLTTSIRIWQ